MDEAGGVSEAAVLLLIFGPIAVWLGLVAIALCRASKDADVQARWEAERQLQERREVECEECEALARALNLLPDPLESLFELPAYDRQRVER